MRVTPDLMPGGQARGQAEFTSAVSAESCPRPEHGSRLERMVDALFRKLRLHKFPHVFFRASPTLGRAAVNAWYGLLTGMDRKGEMVFMNYGYADANGGNGPALRDEDELNRYSIQLYHHLAGHAELRGRDVLEVGCGRGGGCSYVSRYLNPASVTGLDAARGAVRFCRSRHREDGLSFVHGEAEALPFASGSFDVVFNVESSHFYGSVPRFLAEARRVLRPGGTLLFADFRGRAALGTLRGQVARSGLEPVRMESITENVVRALELDNGRKMRLISARVPYLIRAVFREFASTQGSATCAAFRNRTWEYVAFVLRRP